MVVVQNEKPETFLKNKNVAKRNGKVAGDARESAEKELGRSIISDVNNLDFKQDKLKLEE
jgi:DNA-damage-inducible protein D